MVNYLIMRWKFLLPSFLAGFLITIINGNKVSFGLLIGLFLALSSGNGAFYIIVEKLGYIEAFFRSLKYIAVMCLILIIVSALNY